MAIIPLIDVAVRSAVGDDPFWMGLKEWVRGSTHLQAFTFSTCPDYRCRDCAHFPGARFDATGLIYASIYAPHGATP
jgi:hypothetical protein